MSDLWKDVKTWLADSTRSALKESEALARSGRIRMELLGINTALNEKFLELGGVVYDLLRKTGRTSVKTDAKVRRLVADISELENMVRKNDKVVTKKPPRKIKSNSKPTSSGKKAGGKPPRASTAGKPAKRRKSGKGRIKQNVKKSPVKKTSSGSGGKKSQTAKSGAKKSAATGKSFPKGVKKKS